ncbi:MAG: hypothetical protein IM607_12585 [Cytophagales bacterium]|nr:hypothetical protein [Cytophagales bacterium]
MNSIHVSDLGNLLNIRSVFSMFLKTQLKEKQSPLHKLLASIRSTFIDKIKHIGYVQLNTMMLELVKSNSLYNVLTRVSLEQAVNKANPYQLLTAVLLNEDQSTEDALMYLLSPENKSPYTRKELVDRCGIIES